MKRINRTAYLLLLSLLLSTFVGCIHYLPREEETAPESVTEETTAESLETDSTEESNAVTEPDPAATEQDTAYPNEPDDEHSKRY